MRNFVLFPKYEIVENDHELSMNILGPYKEIIYMHSLFISEIKCNFVVEFIVEDPHVVVVLAYLNCHKHPKLDRLKLKSG